MAETLSGITRQFEAARDTRTLTTWLIAKAITKRGEESPIDVMRRIAPNATRMDLIAKAATSGMTTTDPGLDPLRPLASSWADLVRRVTILGRMTPGPRRVPPAVSVTTVDSGVVAASFVTEGAPTPVVRPTLTDASLTPGKIALITPYSFEASRATADRLANLIERDQSRAVALGEDTALLDGGAAVVGGRPASILFGLTPLSGGTADDIEADALALLAAVRGGDPVAPHYITSPGGSRYLIGLRNSGGARVFPNVTVRGGDIFGVPLLVSSGSPDILALADADAIHVVDEDLTIDVSRQSAFQFDSAPSAGAQQSVSLWQTNSIGIKTERFIGWRLAWADGASFMTLPTGSPS